MMPKIERVTPLRSVTPHPPSCVKAKIANNATHIIAFSMTVPPMGAAVYNVKAGTATAVLAKPRSIEEASQTVENDMYSLQFEGSPLPCPLTLRQRYS